MFSYHPPTLAFHSPSTLIVAVVFVFFLSQSVTTEFVSLDEESAQTLGVPMSLGSGNGLM